MHISAECISTVGGLNVLQYDNEEEKGDDDDLMALSKQWRI